MKSNEPNKKVEVEINGIKFFHKISNAEKHIHQHGLKGWKKFLFMKRLNSEIRKASSRLNETFKLKECYYGPFKGEFGHFLAHSLPFLMLLHRKNVKIHYCGLEIHRPFLVDEKGNSIVSTFYPLRDFFGEVPPTSNKTVPPADVQLKIDEFTIKAKNSKFPFWNIADNFYYWFVHRQFVVDNNYLYDLSKVYKSEENLACAIFPRSKGARVSKNNGEPWDYQKILDLLSKFFEIVYVCGHPSQSLELIPTENTELVISSDNSKILEACSNSSLIISQHSGVIYISALLEKPYLLLYKGGKSPSDIGSFQNTLYFLNSFGKDYEINYCFSEEELEQFLNKN
jgi:hypothetical protein